MYVMQKHVHILRVSYNLNIRIDLQEGISLVEEIPYFNANDSGTV